MFNLSTGAHKMHKEFVKMKAGAYYYQPQTQLNDKEVICDDMKGAMTLNVDDDMITTWYTRSTLINACVRTLHTLSQPRRASIAPDLCHENRRGAPGGRQC